MFPKIKKIIAKEDFKLLVTFEDEATVLYDVLDDIRSIPAFEPLEKTPHLFKQFEVDESRTVVSWTNQIDLPSDTIREYGKVVL